MMWLQRNSLDTSAAYWLALCLKVNSFCNHDALITFPNVVTGHSIMHLNNNIFQDECKHFSILCTVTDLLKNLTKGFLISRSDLPEAGIIL